MRYLWIVFSLIFFYGCQTDGAGIIPESLTLADMEFSVEGKTYTGVTTLPRRPGHTFKFSFFPRGEIHSFAIWTCGREVFPAVPKKGPVEYKYRPTYLLENIGACPLRAVSISTKGQRQTAVVDFVNGDTLDADIQCNGRTVKAKGSYLCQLRSGLVMSINPHESVAIESTSPFCGQPRQTIGFRYEIIATRSYCIYTLVTRGLSGNKIFRLNLRTYVSNFDEKKQEKK